MKNKLYILLILLTSMWIAGCTSTGDEVRIMSSNEADIHAHISHVSHYYDADNDTAIPFEELQKRYENHISNAWNSKLRGSLTDVLHHLEKAIQVSDSIQNYTKTETIHMKDYQKMKNKSSQLRNILLTIGCILLVLGLSIYIGKRYKKERETIIKQKDSENSQQQYSIATFKQSELYREILQAAQDDNINLSPMVHPLKWISIQENLDKLFSNFTKRLAEQCPNLSETEQQICWLSKLGIPPSGIARILKLSKQAITNARSRIVKKTTLEDGESIKFDQFIEQF